MKFIVSAAHLYGQLNRIKFGEEYVLSTSIIDRSTLEIVTNEKRVTIGGAVALYEERATFPHENPKKDEWEWVKNVVSKVEDQPIVIDVCEKCMNVLFQM